MELKTEIREFLTSRRGRITPAHAGITAYGVRRVSGLRRSELATLAGVSVEYYTRIERGSLSGVSDNVLEALVGALQLDDAERAHLFDLARASQPIATTRRRRATRLQVRPNVQWVLDSITGSAAFVSNGSHDIIAANRLGEALWSPLYARVDRPVNSARYLFLDPTAREMYPDLERIANETVAIMRHTAGADPRDRRLSQLVGELSMRSEEFRTRWASHDVRFHNTGTKRMMHPVVGELTLHFERFDLAAESGLTMFTYTAERGTRSTQGTNCPPDGERRSLPAWDPRRVFAYVGFGRGGRRVVASVAPFGPLLGRSAIQISSRDSFEVEFVRDAVHDLVGRLPSLRIRRSASRCAASRHWSVCW